MSILRTLASRVRDLIGVIGGFFEEPRVTRHIIVTGSGTGFTIPDPAATLPLNDRHIQDIHAPGLVDHPLPVIMYRTTHTGSMSFSVRLNNTRLTQHTFSGTVPHTWHEVIPKGALKAEHNELTLAVQGDGSVQFSDIVIFYTSNSLTAKIPMPEPVVSPT
jgi:hypothetical protein